MKQLIIVPAILGLAYASTSLTTPAPKQQTVSTANISIQQETGDPEVMPEYPGGKEALMNYLMNTITYPKSLVKENASGKVFVQFVVTKTGAISEVKALKSSGFEAMDAEAIRVIQNMPNWTPGTKEGKAVDVEMTLPIAFTITL